MANTTGKLFEKGKQAFEKKNYEYAIDLFGQVLDGQPDNEEARKLLRETELRKVNEDGYPNPVVAKLTGLIPWIKSMLYNDPEAIVEACEEYLKIDPNDLNTRIRLAQALGELGYHDAAICELQPLTKVYNESPELHKNLAMMYEAVGKNQKSTDHLQKVKELDPTDREVDSMIKNTMAESTVKEGGWDEAESTQDLIRDKQKAQQLERQQKILSDPEEIKEAIQDLKRELKQQDLDDDEQFERWSRIGELFQKMDEYDSSISAYQKALELRPQDGQLKMKIGDIKLRKWDQKVKTVEEKLEQNPDDAELQKKLKKLKKKRLSEQVKEYQQRVKDHPTDMKLRFHYGRYLRQAGKIDEAISQFQQAVKDPNIKTQAYTHLGRGFMDKGHADMAIDQFQNGLDEARSKEREIELRYNLAKAYMENEDWENARANLQQILEEDYGYKDASDLLDQVKEHLD